MKNALTILSLATLLAACSGPGFDQNNSSDDADLNPDLPKVDSPSGGSNTATDAQLLSYWQDNVTDNVTQFYCIVCHSDTSIARDTDWVLLANNQDNYLANNLARTLAYIEADEQNAQTLVDKAQGVSHGGGEILKAGSDENSKWAGFIELATSTQVNTPDTPDLDNDNNTMPSTSRQAAVDFYVDNLENDLIQPDCYVCHQANGVAKNSDLIFVANNVNDYDSFNANTVISYTQTSDNKFNNFLLKPIGQGHAGNKIIDITSGHAQNISAFLALVEVIVDEPEISINTPNNAQASVLLGEVFLVWEMAGEHDGFEIQRKRADGDWISVANLEMNSSLYRDNSVEAGNSYQYRIRAKLAQEYSIFSAALSVSIDQ